jgi:hypothetical protein
MASSAIRLFVQALAVRLSGDRAVSKLAEQGGMTMKPVDCFEPSIAEQNQVASFGWL